MSNEMATYLAPSNTMEAFVAAVKAKMRADGVSQVELARRLGVDQSTISGKLGAKKGNLTFAGADEIASALGSTTIELLQSSSSN